MSHYLDSSGLSYYTQRLKQTLPNGRILLTGTPDNPVDLTAYREPGDYLVTGNYVNAGHSFLEMLTEEGISSAFAFSITIKASIEGTLFLLQEFDAYSVSRTLEYDPQDHSLIEASPWNIGFVSQEMTAIAWYESEEAAQEASSSGILAFYDEEV